jgi:hypothetical protein
MSEESVVRVVRLGEIRKHQNADSLSITDVDGGYPCIIRTGDFKPGDLAVYVPVDSLVPVAAPEFNFLAKEAKADGLARIKARRLRGTFSMGLLVPCTDTSWKEGQDVGGHLGVTKYLPPSEREHVQRPKTERRSETARYEERVEWIAVGLIGVCCVAACVFSPWIVALEPCIAWAGARLIRRNRALNKRPQIPYYDIESVRKYKSELVDGEQVQLTEKIHGCSFVAIHTGKRFFVRSRNVWRDREDNDDIFWIAARRYGLEEKLARYPNLAIFGEVYGAVQDLHYGVPPGESDRFVAFDILDTVKKQWFNSTQFRIFCMAVDVPAVPVLYEGPWHESLLSFAEGKTTMPDGQHCREGFVVKPMVERTSDRLGGRVMLKLHGEGYLTRKEL